MTRRSDAISRLNELLATGDYPPASRLPPERDLARRLRLSRSALREGLEVLEAEGKIWRHVGRGTFVGSRPLPDPVSLSLITAQTSPSEMLETRLVLEPLLAGLAAMRASDAEISHMRYLLAKSEAARDARTWDLWDGRLHRAVAQAAHNALLLSIFDAFNAMRKQARWSRLRQAALTSERHRTYCDHHRAYVAAIQERDAATAEAAMRKHIRAVREGMIGARIA